MTVFFVVALFAGACGDSAATTTTTEAPEATTATTQPPATTNPPATTQATTTTTTTAPPFPVDDALAATDAFFAAFAPADFEALHSLFASDAEFTEFELFRAWEGAQGTVFTDLACSGDQGDVVTIVRCKYGNHPYIARAVGAPPVPSTTRVDFDANGRISGIYEVFGKPDFGTVNDPFDDWMERNYPEDAAKVGCCDGDTVEESVARGELRAQYADVWVAYLEANDCTYEDFGC